MLLRLESHVINVLANRPERIEEPDAHGNARYLSQQRAGKPRASRGAASESRRPWNALDPISERLSGLDRSDMTALRRLAAFSLAGIRVQKATECTRCNMRVADRSDIAALQWLAASCC